MAKSDQFYAEFIEEWEPYAARILSGITIGLRSQGLDVRDIRSEAAGGRVSWYMYVYPGSGPQKLKDEKGILISLQFSPTDLLHARHMAEIYVQDNSWADIESFGLGESLDLADETAVGNAMRNGMDRIDEVVSVVRRQGPVKTYQIKDPETMSKAKLVRMISDLQYFLYWDEDSGQMFLNPEKEINGGDLQQFVDEFMQENGLYPTEMGPKDWKPKRRS